MSRCINTYMKNHLYKNKNYPYVYIGIHKVTGQFYIGYREKNKIQSHLDLGFHYNTCSSAQLVKDNFNDFIWSVVAEFYTETASDDAYWFEQDLIKENIKNPLCLNKHYFDKTLGHNRFSSTSPESRTNISKGRKGILKGKTYEEIYGNEKAKELKQIRSEHLSKIRQEQVSAGKPNPMAGKKRPQSVLDAMDKGRKKSIGKFCWITNGTLSRKHPVCDPIPEGFHKGRDPSFLRISNF